jgi:hypothetical protein
MAFLPQYYGIDPIEESIHDFFSAFEIYCNVKNVSWENRITLLDSVIGDPAKIEYDQAILDGAPNGIAIPDIPPPAAVDAAPNVVAQANREIADAH